MRWILFLALSAFAVFAAAADNAFNVPEGGFQFVAGKPTTITWEPTTDGTVTIKLQKGSDITPDSGIILASGYPNLGSFTWTPSANLGPGDDYTIEIIDENNQNNYNFTPPFAIAGTTGTISSLSASATSSITRSSTSTRTTSRSSSRTTYNSSSSSTSTGSSSGSSTSSATSASQATSAPNPNTAAISLKLPGGMLAAVLAVMALL